MSFFREPFPEDVVNRVKHDYPPEQVEEVLICLSTVSEIYREEIPWIQMAALALAAGDKSLIQQWIELANQDIRDLKMIADGHLRMGWLRDYILYKKRRH